MQALVATARCFHARPSALMAIEDPVLALAIDLAGAVVARDMIEAAQPVAPAGRMLVLGEEP